MTTYNIGSKVTLTVELKGKYNVFNLVGAWGVISSTFLYKMVDVEGNIFVWKTSSNGLMIDEETEKGNIIPVFANIGDIIVIKGTIKGFSTYKGEEQIELTRCKLVSFVQREPTEEEKREMKKREQILSLNGADFIWEMPYRQYKTHYADCETVAGSFTEYDDGKKTVQVIIREGRLKNSGVRGKKFFGYELTNEEGRKCYFTAVSEENAERRASKEYPGHNWEVTNKYTWRV